ncbi:MAG: phenylacetate--CoA ligase family protein, partial [Planctomycetota bacterium]
RGRPMPVLDTPDDWAWWVGCWQYVLDAADVTGADRALLAFSFGPFVGFWSAFDALVSRGVLAIPAGGMSTVARVDLIERSRATLLLCTPSYALHLAEAAAARGIRLADLPVTRIVVAGEPGGSVPATRERIESAWGARVIDHSGATEVGAWSYGETDGSGLRVIESEFLPEFYDVETGEPLNDEDPNSNGRLAHLVLTTLGRYGAPVIRYRTGDLVRPRWDSPNEVRFVRLDGGVLGRADDMMIVRGVNVYPSAIEQILHGFPEVVEYRLTARKRGEMDELVIEVEDQLQAPERIANELVLRLGLKVEVRLATAMSLPRAEHKSARFVDLRRSGPADA